MVIVSKRTYAEARWAHASPPSRRDKASSAGTLGVAEPRAASTEDNSTAPSGEERGTSPSHEWIAARAYQLWEAQGYARRERPGELDRSRTAVASGDPIKQTLILGLLGTLVGALLPLSLACAVAFVVATVTRLFG